MNTPNIFDRLSRKIHHHSDMEPHESDSGPPFDEVEPLNFHDEESVVHTVLEDFYAVGTLADELTDGFHMEACYQGTVQAAVSPESVGNH